MPQIFFIGADGIKSVSGNDPLTNQRRGTGGVSNKEAYNDGYLAGLREAARIQPAGEGRDRKEVRRRTNRKPYSRDSEYSQLDNDNDSDLEVEPNRYRAPRNLTMSQKNMVEQNHSEIPMARKARSRATEVEINPLVDVNATGSRNTAGRMPTQIPNSVFNTENRGTNQKFFDESKVKDISNFRTRDGKNYDEAEELRRQRFVRNANQEPNDQL